ncbi:MAG: 30S ribosomal protein S21 [Chloroflexota bacterium]
MGGPTRVGPFHAIREHAEPCPDQNKEQSMYVVAREGETFEELFRRFKRGIEAAGILRDYRRKQRFKPAHEERRDKIRAAQRKRRRARAKAG